MTEPSQTARLLGYAGLIPQILCLIIIAGGDPQRIFTAQAVAFAYAALIFTFLGGMWWGIAAMMERPPTWLWIAAVTPSLIALVSCWPWAVGTDWPGPSMLVLGALITGSLLVDRRVAALVALPAWWMPLRLRLSLGLGLATLLIGYLSLD
jgi:hypothetical protein